jgi:hypothetical protein
MMDVADELQAARYVAEAHLDSIGDPTDGAAPLVKAKG